MEWEPNSKFKKTPQYKISQNFHEVGAEFKIQKTPNTKFHRIFMEWEPNCPTQSGERDRDLMRLTVAFRNLLNAPKKGSTMEERAERNSLKGGYSVWTRDHVATVRNE